MSRTVIAVVDDMFFASKIRATAEALNVDVSFPRSTTALLEKAHEKVPDMVLVDLHNQRIGPVEVATTLKSDEALRDVWLLGFFSHVQTELQQSAVAAGYNQVVPRSLFTRDLAQILLGR